MFLVFTGSEFHLTALLYRTLFLYFSHFGIMVLNNVAARALVLTFFILSNSIQSGFSYMYFTKCPSRRSLSFATFASLSSISSGVF